MSLDNLFGRKHGLPVSPEQDCLYEREETEIIALIMNDAFASRAAGKKLWLASQRLIGYMELPSGRLCRSRCALHWEIDDKRLAAPGKGLGLKKETCCRLIVRKSLEREAYGNTVPRGQSLYVVRVVKSCCTEARLEPLLEEFRKPINLLTDSGVQLTLNRRMEVYEGELPFGRDICSLTLAANDDDSPAPAAMAALDKIAPELARWEEEARCFAADELTELANDWLQEGEDAVSRNDLFRRLKGQPSLSIDHDGGLEFIFGDDDLFAGHWIVVQGSIEKGFTDATIEG